MRDEAGDSCSTQHVSKSEAKGAIESAIEIIERIRQLHSDIFLDPENILKNIV